MVYYPRIYDMTCGSRRVESLTEVVVLFRLMLLVFKYCDSCIRVSIAVTLQSMESLSDSTVQLKKIVLFSNFLLKYFTVLCNEDDTSRMRARFCSDYLAVKNVIATRLS